MKIYSETLDYDGRQVLILFLDTQKTGDPEKDVFNCGLDLSSFDSNDSEQLIGMLIPSITEMIIHAYGEKPEPYGKKEPLTKYSTTGFDPNYPNGVKA